jgi:ATP-binding cassette, subfamily B, bacterial
VGTGIIRSFRSATQDRSVLKQKVSPGTLKRTLKFAAPYTPLLVLFLGVVVADAAVGVASPLVYRAIINNGILKQSTSVILRLAGLLAILGVVDAALGLTQSYIAARIGARIVLTLRTELFDHIQQMPLAFFTRTQTGALVSRLNGDVGGARTAFTDILSNGIGNLVTAALILVAMFALSWRITLAAMVLLPVFIFPARIWGRKLQEITRESYDLRAAMNNTMVERFNVAGAQLAKLFGRRREEGLAFEAKAERVSAIGVKRAVYGRLFFTALFVVASLATALAYGWGGVLAVHHVLDVGTVVALASYLVRLYAPLVGLSNIQVSVMTALVSFDRVFEVLDLEPMIRDSPGAADIRPGPATIDFDHVAFRYPAASEVSLASLEAVPTRDMKGSEKLVLHDITFRADAGQLVALVGPSGAGKTTITQLIPRLYDVQSGSVRIDDVDVRNATQESLRQRIGVVTQDAHLFHDTIRANLLYAKPDAPDAELLDALGAAQILPLVTSLKEGLDTLVGERGYRFSGGEKQRLAIARLLLKAPDIVILDEATAHLDSASEEAIQIAFETALSGRTSIVIAHRLSTILKADLILVVEAGRITQRGTHAQLVEQEGVYRELYQKQFAPRGGPGVAELPA